MATNPQRLPAPRKWLCGDLECDTLTVGGVPMLPERAGVVAGSAFSPDVNGLYVYDVVFATPTAGVNYAIAINAGESRTFTFESVTVNGFRIQTNSTVALGALSKITWFAKEA